MDPFSYPEPIQGDPEMQVSRQVGISEADLAARVAEDAAQHLGPVIQPGGDLVVSRQTGIVATALQSAGVLVADHPVDGGGAVLVADSPISATTDAGFPGRPGVVPGIPVATAALSAAKTARGRKAAQPTAGVFMADTLKRGDPRDPGSAPVAFTAEQLAAARAAKR